MSFNEKLSDVYDKILSMKDEVDSVSCRLESGDIEDNALKRSMNNIENQGFAQNRKVEIATFNSKKHCLDLEVEALSKSKDLRLSTVLRDAQIEAIKKEKSYLQEDIRKMRNQKKDFLAKLHSLTLEAERLNLDEKRNKEGSLEEHSEETHFADLSAKLNDAKEKDALLRTSFEETATVLSRDQNDIKHILDELAKSNKKRESIIQTLETIDVNPSENNRTSATVKNVFKNTSSVVSNTTATKMKIAQCEKEIEDKCLQLKDALENVNKLLEMERQGRMTTGVMVINLDEAVASLEDKRHDIGH